MRRPYHLITIILCYFLINLLLLSYLCLSQSPAIIQKGPGQLFIFVNYLCLSWSPDLIAIIEFILFGAQLWSVYNYYPCPSWSPDCNYPERTSHIFIFDNYLCLSWSPDCHYPEKTQSSNYLHFRISHDHQIVIIFASPDYRITIIVRRPYHLATIILRGPGHLIIFENNLCLSWSPDCQYLIPVIWYSIMIFVSVIILASP